MSHDNHNLHHIRNEGFCSVFHNVLYESSRNWWSKEVGMSTSSYTFIHSFCLLVHPYILQESLTSEINHVNAIVVSEVQWQPWMFSLFFCAFAEDHNRLPDRESWVKSASLLLLLLCFCFHAYQCLIVSKAAVHDSVFGPSLSLSALPEKTKYYPP